MKALLPLCAALFSGCIQTIAIRAVGNIVDEGFGAIAGEQDLAFAEQALPANLKLLEVMLKGDPDNERILLLLSEGYSSYALGFVEDKDVERARMFYLRGKEFGMRVLQQDPWLAQALRGSPEDLKTELGRRGRDDVRAVFWTAFGLGSYINLSLTDPDALIELPRAEAMMRFVASTDSSFYYGGAYLFLGTLYGSRPRILGGDADLSRQYFEKALAINRGKFLMTHVYYARSYAVQTLNESLFDDLLRKVDEATLEILPEFRLANAIAKQKAKSLLSRKAKLF